MGIQLDFKQPNQAIARFNQFLQYDLLDQLRSDRDTDIMKIQDKLIREREIEKGGIDMKVAEFKSALTDKEAYTKAMLDYAKLPGADYEIAMARLATDRNLNPEYHEIAQGAAKRYANKVVRLAAAAQAASNGEISIQQYIDILEGMDTKGLMDMTKEAGMVKRAKMVAGTAADNESATSKSNVQKTYLDWIDKTVAHLEGEGVKGKSMIDAIIWATGSKFRSPLSPEAQGAALQHLNEIRLKVMHGEQVTPPDEEYVSRLWNATRVNIESGIYKPLPETVPGTNIPRTAGGGAPPATPGAQRGKPFPGIGEGKAPAAPVATAPAPRTATYGARQLGKDQVSPYDKTGINPKTGTTYDQDWNIFSRLRENLYNKKVEEHKWITAGGSPTPDQLKMIQKDALEYVDTMTGPDLWEYWNDLTSIILIK